MGCDSSKEPQVLANHTTSAGNNNAKHENSNGMQPDAAEVEAATKIQAAFRGHKVRSTMKKGDAASNDNTEREPTKEELEAEFDLNDEDLKHAATRIQACFRGHIERKKVPVKEDAKEGGVPEVDIDEITKKVSEELGIDLDDPELNKAATKIQATFRGHKTRKTDEGTSN